MTKVLVTGANGQLGSELRSLASAYSDLIFNFTDINDVDITDKNQIWDFLENNRIDYIINGAAYTDVDKAESEPDIASLINTEAVQNLVIAAEEFDTRIIHISTDYVFPGTNFLPYKENDATGPSSVYGQTKFEGEQEVLNSKTESIIIRASWLYSSYGNNFVKSMIRLGSQNEMLKIIFDQIGTPTYAGDLAKTILEIIDKVEKKQSDFKTGIYHYSNEGVASWYDFAYEIMQMKEIDCKVLPIETKDYPTAAKRPAYSVLNKEKIKTTFKIEIPYWKDSLSVCLEKINV